MSNKSITLEGSPIELTGNEVVVGDVAPDFTAVNGELEDVRFTAEDATPCVISSVVSLDTPVCDKQTRRFNEEATSLSDNLGIYVLSMDLPFAQKRWCGAADIERVTTLSDYRDRAFGQSYGLLIKGLGLLARAVFVVDSDGIIRYKEIVSEVTEHPDYDQLFEAVRAVNL
ncbi:MAG: thiol peroxidase [Planctomycetota bacterium]